MKTYFNQSIIALALALALAGLSNPCFAESNVKWVKFSDLNLDKPGDVVVLYKRIQKAATDVCVGNLPYTWVIHRKAFNRCFQRTVDKAVMKIDNPALTSYHLDRNQNVAKR